MVDSEEQKRSPLNQKKTLMESNSQNNVSSSAAAANLISPRFKSAAAMVGWDEEALLLASLIVEDTPDRDPKQKKRFVLNSKSPSSNSSRKRRARRTVQSIPVTILNLDEEETPKKDSAKKKKEKKNCVRGEGSSSSKMELTQKNNSGVSSTTTTTTAAALPCIDKLREELSCAICLEICFEPSTTPCGHSFCRKCLRSAADKCGKKCPKCRQLISNGRSCTVNTVLWNTIQLLFPQEVEARKVAAAASTSSKNSVQCLSPEEAFYSNVSNRSIQPIVASRRSMRENEVQNNYRTAITRSQTLSSSTTTSGRVRTRRGGGVTSQNEDAALALRLQREEFMQAFRSNGSQALQEQSTVSSTSSSLARANLRAMASRAMNIRIRDRRM